MCALLFRRFFNNVNQWRVGVSAATHSFCDRKSGFLTCEWEEADPWVKLGIPGGVNAVYQIIRNPDVSGLIRIRDYNAIVQLLYNTDVQGAVAGDQYAVTVDFRNVIDYFAIVTDNAKIVVATETPATGTTFYSFTNARIGRIFKEHSTPASPWVVEFYADYVTQVDV